MALSRVDYVAAAAQTDFTVTFAFLKEAHVTLKIDSVASTDFTLPSSTILRLDTPAVGGELIEIIRVTPDTLAGQLVDFSGGTPVTEGNMDLFYQQLLYIAQEIQDDVDSVMAGGNMVGPPGGADSFLVSDGVAWVTKSLGATKTVLKLPSTVGADGVFLVSDGSSYVEENSLTARTSLNLENYPVTDPAINAFLTGNGTGTAWIENTPSGARTAMGLGTAAVVNTGVANGDVPLMDATGYPAADGSQITNLSGIGTLVQDLIRYNMEPTPAAPVALFDTVSATWYQDVNTTIEINGLLDSNGSVPYRNQSRIQHSLVSDTWTVDEGLWLVHVVASFHNTDTTGGAREFELDLVRTDGTDTRQNMFPHELRGAIAQGSSTNYSTISVSAVKILNITTANQIFELRAREDIAAAGTVEMDSGQVTWIRLGDNE